MTTAAFYYRHGSSVGWGHKVRCEALAGELERRGWTCYLGQQFCPSQVCIVDYPADDLITPQARQTLFDCELIVSLTPPDDSALRMESGLIFYQGVTNRPYSLDWSLIKAQWYEGPKWIILRREFDRVHPGDRAPSRPPKIVVCAGGGGDPHGIRELATQALKRDFYTKTIFGKPPSEMVGFLSWGDVAVVSYGMTAFECLALGIPTVAISISEDHAASAELVQERSGGALVHVGRVEDVNEADVYWAVEGQLANYSIKSRLARQYVDGRGLYRVADKIMEVYNDVAE